MNSLQVGKNISIPEITHVSKHGIWLLAKNQECFMPFESFPWFKQASVENILQVEEISPDHFYWSALDIDLTLEMIKYPARFPLQASL